MHSRDSAILPMAGARVHKCIIIMTSFLAACQPESTPPWRTAPACNLCASRAEDYTVLLYTAQRLVLVWYQRRAPVETAVTLSSLPFLLLLLCYAVLQLGSGQ